MKIFFRKN